MIIEHIGLDAINGSLVVLDNVKGAEFDEMVELRLDNGTKRIGRIVQIDGDRVVIQVFEGTLDKRKDDRIERAKMLSNLLKTYEEILLHYYKAFLILHKLNSFHIQL